MKSYLLVILLFCICLFQTAAQAPDWVWARSGQSSNQGGSEGISVATDHSNNMYVTGYYGDTIAFGPYSLTTLGNENAFLTKYDPYGNVIWARGNVSLTNLSSAEGYAVCTDASANCYLTGSCWDGVSFGSYTLMGSMFVVKYDSSGNVLWAKTSSAGVGNVYAAAVDAFGNVFVAGSFGAPYITLGSYTLNCTGSEDIFIAKYDSSGNVLWAKRAGGSTGRDAAHSVATDASGNAYITGNFFSDTCFFDSYALANADPNAFHSDFFIAKYDPSGNVLWAKRSGGTDDDQGNGVATDASQNIYVEGMFFSSSITFDTYTFTNTSVADFLVKYNPSGNVIWAKKIGGIANAPLFGEHCLATDNYGKLYFTGTFSAFSITFDTVTLLRPSGGNDCMFIAGYDSAGHALFAKALQSGGDDWNAVATSPSGCVYVGGDFGIQHMTIGIDTLTLMPTSSTENVFVAKLCSSGVLANFNSSDTVFCSESGNCINFFDRSAGIPISWQWHFTGGTPDTSSLQNPTNICYNTPGTYPVSLIVSDGVNYDTLTVSPLIIFGTAPAVPTVTVGSGDTLFSSHGFSYQWFLNGNAIGGATDSFYVAHQGGTYSVQISDSTLNCHSISAGVLITSVNFLNDEEVSIYPNPVANKFTVYDLRFTDVALINIFNVLGEVVYSLHPETVNSKAETAIDVSSLSSGIYLLKTENGGRIFTKKFVVMHK